MILTPMALLRSQGIEPYLFSDTMEAAMSIPPAARNEFRYLLERYSGDIPDADLKASLGVPATARDNQQIERTNRLPGSTRFPGLFLAPRVRIPRAILLTRHSL